MKYKIQMVNGVGGKWTEIVEGEPLVIPGWEEFQFFSRRVNPDSAYDESIIVSEVQTGYQVGDIHLTEAQAIADITKRLETKGAQAIRDMIEQLAIG